MSVSKLLTMAAAVGLAGTAFGQGMGPGTIGYVQGQAALDGKPLMPGSEEQVTLKAGEMLSTGTGRAAVELMPGVVLRVEPASVVKMVEVERGKSEVMLQSGKANVVVGNVAGSRDLQVDTANGVQTLLLKRGVYAFDAQAGELKVYDGKAAVSENADAKWINVKEGHELALNGTANKPAEFDDRQDRADLGWGGGVGYGGGYGSGYGPYGDGFGNGYGYGPAFFDGFYGPYAYGFYPGFYGGFYPGFYGGGFGYGYGFRGGFGGGFGGFRGGGRR